jgi:nucleotide-binding universal stress UspA family protein
VYDHILIPTDGSEDAAKGAEHGLELAEALGATVHALYVIDLPGAPRAMSIRDDEEEMREEYEAFAEEVTGSVCQAASENGLECVTAHRTGKPAEEIVAYAEEEGLDAIVMGSAYKGTIGTVFGSTSNRVVNSATVPVITTRMRVDD